jgi:hypothetical protein
VKTEWKLILANAYDRWSVPRLPDGRRLKVCSAEGWADFGADGTTMPFGAHEGEDINTLPVGYIAWVLLEFAPTFDDDDNGLFDALEEVLADRGFERKEGIRKTPHGERFIAWYERVQRDGTISRVPW